MNWGKSRRRFLVRRECQISSLLKVFAVRSHPAVPFEVVTNTKERANPKREIKMRNIRVGSIGGFLVFSMKSAA